MRDTVRARNGRGRSGAETTRDPSSGAETTRDPMETAQATFACTECGMELPARRGACPSCGTWWTTMDCLPGQMRQIAPPDERGGGE